MKHDHWARPIRARVHTLARYIYDGGRYLKYSSAVGYPSQTWQRRAYLMKLAHVVEKGLALPNTRLNFGEENIRQMCEALLADPWQGTTAQVMALSALQSYVDFHERNGAEAMPLCQEVLDKLKGSAALGGSLREVSRQEIATAVSGADAFMRTRHSVRQFAETPVSLEALQRAVSLAQTTPSVCNRQAGRIHIITDKALMAEALAFQGGNRGFGDSFGAVAIITAELGSFLEPNERNQAYVDGGMFAMAFLLGLHAQTLGACPLNWSRNPITDVKFRKAISIPASESVIMFVGIGNLRETYDVAGSARLPLDDVMTVITASSK